MLYEQNYKETQGINKRQIAAVLAICDRDSRDTWIWKISPFSDYNPFRCISGSQELVVIKVVCFPITRLVFIAILKIENSRHTYIVINTGVRTSKYTQMYNTN